METEKSHDLPRTVSGVLPSRPEGLRIRVVSGISHSEDGGKPVFLLSSHRERPILPFSSLMFHPGPSVDWMGPTRMEEQSAFTQFTDSNVNLFWEHPQTHSKIMLDTSYKTDASSMDCSSRDR